MNFLFMEFLESIDARIEKAFTIKDFLALRDEVRDQRREVGRKIESSHASREIDTELESLGSLSRRIREKFIKKFPDVSALRNAMREFPEERRNEIIEWWMVARHGV